MRLVPVLLAVAVGLTALAGCGTSEGAREPGDPNVIEGDDIERRDLHRVQDMLRGQVAGVRVAEVGGSLVIRVRGPSSFGNQDPLFVIDGLPIALGAEGALTGLSPSDVASIRVLKNASDTAIYGSRGANGVVLITTRRPPPPGGRESGGS